MVTQTDYGPKWEQSDFNRAKNAVQSIDSVDFQSSASRHGSVDKPALEFSIRGGLEREEIDQFFTTLYDALNSEGFDISGSTLKSGYAGATNSSLMVVVRFTQFVYQSSKTD